MIETLTIKNCALIEEIEINFGENLNILSGETGSGKSIIINSIGFLLGQKLDVDFIRTGQDMADVSAIFYIRISETIDKIKELGIEILDDNLLLLHRTMNRTGKTISRANGKIISLVILKSLSKLLIDIHSQHEHQFLLNENHHIEFLDKFCDILSLKKELMMLFKQFKEVSKNIQDLRIDEREKLSKIDLFNFQIKDIESAELSVNEEENLISRKKILQSSEKISKNVNEAIMNLYDENESGIDKINNAIYNINQLVSLDNTKKDLLERLESTKTELEDIVAVLKDYFQSIDHDPNEIDTIESRLDVIYNLKRKYGNSVNEIINYCDKLKSEVNLINNSEEQLKIFEKQKLELLKKSNVICEKISEIRKLEATKLENAIKDVLMDLGMKDVNFFISIQKLDNFSDNGFDKVEFLISSNRGEPLKQLSKISSGGEMSRIMLSIKTILAKVYGIDTYIFDEIDTGVSGRTAQMVAEKLKIISKKHQILCITHLPQIASMASDHFVIEKKSNEKNTFTSVTKLDSNSSTNEIARLIGGAKITEQTLKAASEMLYQAKKFF